MIIHFSWCGFKKKKEKKQEVSENFIMQQSIKVPRSLVYVSRRVEACRCMFVWVCACEEIKSAESMELAWLKYKVMAIIYSYCGVAGRIEVALAVAHREALLNVHRPVWTRSWLFRHGRSISGKQYTT
jgi:hypothetical protein